MKKMKKYKEQQSPSEISYNFLTLLLDLNSKKKSGIPHILVACLVRARWSFVPLSYTAVASSHGISGIRHLGLSVRGFLRQKINVNANSPPSPALAC